MSVLYIRGADGAFQPVPSLQGESVSPLTVYPVGSVYISVSETSPASLFGGTWERIKDTFLLAAGDSYAAGSTGGEATHTLTIEEMPEHIHDKLGVSSAYLCAWASEGVSTAGMFDLKSLFSESLADQYSLSTLPAGGDEAHNNMPPYYAVYMWRRTA